MNKGNLSKRILAARSQRKGATGEDIARRALINLGFKCIVPIHTGMKQNPRTKKMYYSEAVTGDFHAVGNKGLSVLVEVKTHNEATLTYSFLKPHQHKDLGNHYIAGGLTYLIWVHDWIPYVIEWPILGFVPRTSISLEQAQRLSVL